MCNVAVGTQAWGCFVELLHIKGSQAPCIEGTLCESLLGECVCLHRLWCDQQHTHTVQMAPSPGLTQPLCPLEKEWIMVNWPQVFNFVLCTFEGFDR